MTRERWMASRNTRKPDVAARGTECARSSRPSPSTIVASTSAIDAASRSKNPASDPRSTALMRSGRSRARRRRPVSTTLRSEWSTLCCRLGLRAETPMAEAWDYPLNIGTTLKAAMNPLRGSVLPLILLALTACDNVGWGGVEVAVVRPPKVSGAPATSGEEVEERLPTGPVLYYINSTAGGAVMVPVGEISGDTMIALRARRDAAVFAQRLIAEHMRQGAEFVLYQNGSRVGTFVIQGAEPPAANVCPALPRATGAMELASGATGLGEFLAIAESYA